MKKIFNPVTLLLLLAALSCSHIENQSTPEGYVRHCVRLLDRQGLYANLSDWKVKKKEILSSAETISTLDAAHSLVRDAAKVAGGKHSFLAPPVSDTASYAEVAPEVRILEGNILHLILPSHTGVMVSDSIYIHAVFDFLQEHLDANGVIVDLRNNTGGNMYPMIASVSPLLPDGIVIKFKRRSRAIPFFLYRRIVAIPLEYVTRSYGISRKSTAVFPSSTPVALLTDGGTASAGEATLLCFRGLDNTKTFGSPTAGYASGNVTHTLSDGYRLAITTSSEVARTGEVFCEDPIEPVVNTDSPLEDAIAWIGSVD